MPKFLKKKLHLYLTIVLFILFSVTFVIAVREYRARDLQKIEPCTAACDSSFYTVNSPAGYSFVNGCLTTGQQIYTDDSRFTFFGMPSALQALPYVRSPNVGIKDSLSLNWSIQTNRSARVYILSRYIPGKQAPAWIRSQYTRMTNDDMTNLQQFVLRKNDLGLIGLYEIYYRDVSAGNIPFYSASDDGTAYSMYLVALQPLTAPTSTGEPTASPTVRPSPSLPPVGQSQGVWLSKDEIMKLPTSGSAWNVVVSAANSSWGGACLNDNNCDHDVHTLAGALVAVRNNDSAMRAKTIAGLTAATSSSLSRALELSRGLQTYIIAADIIGYHDAAFEAWVRRMLTVNVSGHSGGSGVLGTAENSSNNWGGHARASLAAAAIYLNDSSLKQTVVLAHKAFNGTAKSPKMVFTDTNWHADPNNKAGVNRKGATIQGRNVSGVLPEDWRRAADYKWPPAATGYMWEGMQGYVVTAVILHRAGLVPFSDGDSAVVRAMDILYQRGESAGSGYTNPASGDDTWIPWVVNYYGGTSYPTQSASSGKNMGYTDWTHAR